MSGLDYLQLDMDGEAVYFNPAHVVSMALVVVLAPAKGCACGYDRDPSNPKPPNPTCPQHGRTEVKS